MISTYLFSLVTFLWGVIATPVSIGLAEKFRLLDVPGGRKHHANIMPRGAGIVLWSGYLLWALFIGNMGVEVPHIATGACIVFLVGYMDDMHPLPPLFRLFFHFCSAACIAYFMPLPLWQRLLLVFWITGMINAFNMVDGMDGLCLTMSLISSVMALAAGAVSVVWLPLSALIFAVLLWNFPSPRTFLGDGGSTLLGFICASHIAWSFFPEMYGQNFIKTSVILVLIGGVPVIDTLSVMLRRISDKKSPFLPDRRHAHHKLQDKGLSKFTTLVVLGLCHAAVIYLGYRILGINFNLYLRKLLF